MKSIVITFFLSVSSFVRADNYFPARFQCSSNSSQGVFTFYLGANCKGCTVMDFPNKTRVYGGFNSCAVYGAWMPNRVAECLVDGAYHDPTHGDYRLSKYHLVASYKKGNTSAQDSAKVSLEYITVTGKRTELLKEAACTIRPFSEFPNYP